MGFCLKKNTTHKGSEILYQTGKGAKALNKSHKVQRCASITEALEEKYIFKAMASANRKAERMAKRKK